MAHKIGFNTVAGNYKEVVIGNDLEEQDFWGIIKTDAQEVLLGIKVGAYWVDETEEWKPAQDVIDYLKTQANPVERNFIIDTDLISNMGDPVAFEEIVDWVNENFQFDGWETTVELQYDDTVRMYFTRDEDENDDSENDENEDDDNEDYEDAESAPFSDVNLIKGSDGYYMNIAHKIETEDNDDDDDEDEDLA